MKTQFKRLVLPVLILIFASLACNFGSGDDPETVVSDPTDTAVSEPTATSAPTATPLPDPTAIPMGDEYRSEEGGFSFQLLPGWEIEEDASFIAHQSVGADPELGPAILMAPVFSDVEMTLDEAYEDFLLGFDTGPDGNITLGTSFYTEIDGFPARSVDITGSTDDGTEMLGQILVVLVSPYHALDIFAYSVADLWPVEVFDYYLAFTETLAFFDPMGAVEIPDETDGELLYQWGGYAEASSQYSSSDWSASQITGPPDVYPDCGDFEGAWAMAEYDTLDWIEILFPKPVIPTEVNIFETYNPGRIVGMDVLGLDGEYTTVFYGAPVVGADCPAILTIYPEVDFPITGVLIYVDTVGLGDWAEIDAVELVGYPITD